MAVVGQYPLAVVGRSDGLPSGQIHGLAAATGRQLWCATPNGLAHHDGLRTTTLTRSDGLSTHGLRSVAVAPDGCVWVGGDVGVDRVTPGGGIESLVGGWSWGLVDDLAITSDGTVVAASAGGVLVRKPDGQWQQADDDRLRTLVRRVAVGEGADESWWAASPSTGLFRRSVAGWVTPQHDDWRTVGVITSLAGQPDGTLLVAGESGVVHIDRSGRTARPVDQVEGAVTAVWANDSEMWLGAGGRLLVMTLRRGHWVVRDEVLRDVRVNRVTGDEDGNVWVATDGMGVVVVDGIRDAIYRPELPGLGAVYAVRRSRRGDLLIGGDLSSVRLSLGRDPQSSPLPGLTGQRCWDIVEDGDDRLWAATDSGLIRVDDDQVTAVGVGHPVLNAPGRSLLLRSETLWVGTLAGLAIVDQATIRAVEFNDQQLGYVYTLVDGGRGVWVGTLGAGLWFVEDGQPRRVLGEGLTETGNTYAIACRPDGRAVVIQDDRIVVVDTELSRIVSRSSDALAGWTLVLGREDDVYVGGSSGLRRYDLTTGEASLHCTLWMGLEGWEFTTSRSMLRDEHDRLLCGLSAGFTAVDLHELRRLAAARPEVALSGIVWSNVRPEIAGGVYDVFEGKWSAEVTVNAVWPLRESALEFRHRLLGFTTDWSVPDPSGRIGFSSLPPGWYSLEVQVHSPLAGWGQTRELVTVHVRSRGWKQRLKDGRLTRSGRLTRRLIRENQALEQRVRERTRELDRAGAELRRINRELALLSITDGLTGLANRRQFDDTLYEQSAVARATGRPLSLLLIDVDDFKAYNDSVGHVAGDQCLRRLADLMRDVVRGASDVVARYGGEEFAAILPDTDAAPALHVAERLRRCVEALGLHHPSSRGGSVVTVSVGVATTSGGGPAEDSGLHLRLVRASDEALYSAKATGRNRVVAADLVG